MLTKINLKKIGRPFRNIFLFSKYNVKEVRGGYMYIIEDKKHDLQYMREIELQDGQRGIVLKIQQPQNTYIAMYQNIPKQKQYSFQIKNSSIPWQKSVQKMKQAIIKKKNKCIFDVNSNAIYSRQHQKVQIQQKEFNKKLFSFTPILNICYDINYGNMYNFSGCLGSKKSQTLNHILNNYTNNQNHIGLYFNPTNYNQTQKIVENTGSWGFNNGNLKKQNYTGVGLYMLCLKVIYLGKQLSKEGYNVLLGLDNFVNVLYSQWEMLQLLNNINIQKTGQFVYNNAPKISPISLLNELYVNSVDYNIKKGDISKGSLTSILITENKSNNDLIPEITPYTNNLKHLSSLAKVINFPINIKHNNNVKQYLPVNSQKNKDYYQKIIRFHINQYLREKQETQLKRKLYKSDMIEAPWDYYCILDSQWWLQGLRNFKISQNIEQYTNFIKWIGMNIQEQVIAHWRISCFEGFVRFNGFLSKNGKKANNQSFFQFISEQRFEGFYSPFKKDYLS